MDLNFRSPTINDRDWVRKILEKGENINSESTFGTCYLWAEAFNTKICLNQNIFFKKNGKNHNYYEFPKGLTNSDELKNSVRKLFFEARNSKNSEFKFTELLNSETLKIQESFPGKFKFLPKRESFEYIYRTKDLALLPGKKYHSKKNHIAKFSKTFNWQYQPITSQNLLECENFFKKWFMLKFPDKKIKTIKEYNAIEKSIKNFDFLNLYGGIIKINSQIIACTIGEEINEKVFLIHFEKALPDFSDAYSIINNEFAKTLYPKYEFINREEDMGIEGLRKSKLSYHPVILIPKYEAVLKDIINDYI